MSKFLSTPIVSQELKSDRVWRSAEPNLSMIGQRRIQTRWLVSWQYDLLWYILPCVTGYLLFYAHLGLGISVLLLVWFWNISVDSPHLFATYSRTYLDKQEWQHRSLLFKVSIVLFFIGPASVGVGLYLNTKAPFLVFSALAQVWAYWHIVRQHYGFLVLYQKKNGEKAGIDNPIDYYCFYLLMLAPYISFILRHYQARMQLGLSLIPTTLESAIIQGLHIVIVLSVTYYVGKEIFNRIKNRPINLPKNLHLLSCIPLHLFVLLHPAISTYVNIILPQVLLTYFHNVQYQGIVWFYNKNRYNKDLAGTQYGWASRISTNFAVYYAAALIFTLFTRYPGWFFIGMKVPLLPGMNAISQYQLGNLFTISELAIGLWWGFSLHHYYLDQKIWRVSKDSQLNRDLKLVRG